MSYKKPLLVELYSEFHFAPGTLNPSTYFDIVPKLKGCGLTNVELGEVFGLNIALQKDGPAVGPQTSTPHVRCWSPAKDQLAQMLQNMLVVNVVVDQTRPYRGWGDFIEFVGSVAGCARSAMATWPLESLSLNTIDRFDVPREGFRLGRYLNCGGPRLPQWYDDAAESCDVILGRGVVKLEGRNRQLRISVRFIDEKVRVDIQSAFHDRLADSDGYITLLEKLHEESNRSFESLLTDETRQKVMGGAR